MTGRLDADFELPNGNFHRGQPVLISGRLEGRSAAVVLMHGRGGSAEGILGLSRQLERDEVVYLAPQARGHSWYPHSFLAEIEDNEPYLSSALDLVSGVLSEIDRRGIPAERTILMGFSQGACLTAEFALRNVGRFGGVVCLTGGYAGPAGLVRSEQGSFHGTPVFLGSGDPDSHVPWSRVQETAEVFARLKADVTLKRYPGMAHAVNQEELDWVRKLMDRVLIPS